MPFTAPVLDIGSGLANGILSGANSLQKGIEYVRDQYKNAKAAQGTMDALGAMQDQSGHPLVPPGVMSMFQKQTPEAQYAMAGMFASRAQNMWDAQNKISIAQAGAQAEGSQTRQTYQAQLDAINQAIKNRQNTTVDPNKSIVNPVTAKPGAQKTLADGTYQMQVGNGYHSFQVKNGNPVPNSNSYVGQNPVPNTPFFPQQ